MIGLTDPVMASNLTAPSCSVAEDMTEGVVVEDSVGILARCATTTHEGNLRASTSDLVSGAAMAPNSDLDALQKATSVDGLSIPVTVNRGDNGAGL